MDVFTCMLLSTHKQAFARISSGAGILSKVLYIIRVTVGTDDTFTVDIFFVIYPPMTLKRIQQDNPHLAEVPHYTNSYDKQDLKDFLKQHAFDQLTWYPSEDYNDMVNG